MKFAFLVKHNLFPWQCYFNMSLSLENQLFQTYNNVKFNKNAATAGLCQQEHNVSQLIFASCQVRVILLSQVFLKSR